MQIKQICKILNLTIQNTVNSDGIALLASFDDFSSSFLLAYFYNECTDSLESAIYSSLTQNKNVLSCLKHYQPML